ncbi:MAG TPA: hypothetical protein VJ994_05790 [Paracoccaceae bacterium]|nr:hypothetical protein [Paracoccaceae bacterium]
MILPARVPAIAGLLLAGLAGCSGPDEPAPVQAGLVQPDCYTVDLYQPPRYVEPGPDVPATHTDYLGQWGGGAWNGLVCHDLWVLEVDGDGRVTMLDAHGPGLYPDATAFERVGTIDGNGRLNVRKGTSRVQYWIEDGRLHGVRRRGDQEIRIIMERRSAAG